MIPRPWKPCPRALRVEIPCAGTRLALDREASNGDADPAQTELLLQAVLAAHDGNAPPDGLMALFGTARLGKGWVTGLIVLGVGADRNVLPVALLANVGGTAETARNWAELFAPAATHRAVADLAQWRAEFGGARARAGIEAIRAAAHRLSTSRTVQSPIRRGVS